MKNRDKITAVMLTAFSVLLICAVFVKAVGLFVTKYKTNSLVEDSFEANKWEPNELEKYLNTDKKLTEELKKSNLFLPSAQKKHPVGNVAGILGNEVLINGKWYKKGDKIADAEIVRIHPTYVTIKWDGNKKDFAPIAANSNVKNGPGGERGIKKERDGRPRGNPAARFRPQDRRNAPRPVGTDNPLTWLGIKLSDSARAKFLEQWNKMSDEQKSRTKERWAKMSDEQKEKAAEQWQEM